MTGVWRPFMERALELAARGGPAVLPNPRVGAVVVKGRRVVGEGWHKRCGGAHAERAALRAAGPAARGATVVVTLEPCSHHGRTPPCTDALVAAGVKRVVYGASDPNPAVSGARVLRRAGVEVRGGILATKARRLNPGFHRSQKTGLPHLHLKVATSLDGYMCTEDGHSQWLTGPLARREGHRLRGRAAAILTGVGTVLADDPRLDVRHGPKRRPARVILDSRARTPATARLFRQGGPVHVICTPAATARRRNALARAGATVHVVADDGGGRVDLVEALTVGCTLGFTEIHVEAGPELSGVLLRRGLVGEVSWFQAPLLLGSGRGPGPLGVNDPSAALRLERTTTRELGPDRLWHGHLAAVTAPLL